MKLPFFRRWKKAVHDKTPPSWENHIIDSLKELVGKEGLRKIGGRSGSTLDY